jgi:chromosome segregation ATPase
MAEEHPSQIVDKLCTALSSRDAGLRNEYHAMLDALQEQAQALTASLAQARETADRSGTLADSAQHELTAIRDAVLRGAADRVRVEELEKELEALSTVRLEAAERVREVEQALERQQHATATAGALTHDLEKALDEEKQRHLAVQERLEGAERALEERAASLKKAECRLESLQDESASLAHDHERAEKTLQQVIELEKTLAGQSDAFQAAKSRIAELEKANGALMEEVGTLQERHNEALEAHAAHANELEHLRQELEAPKAVAQDQVDELRLLLNAERERADILENRLREEHARGTKLTLAKQLADALQDREEAFSELTYLRTELELARPLPSATQISETPRGKSPETLRRTGNGRKRLLGQLLVESGSITDEQLQEALEEQQSEPQMKVGDILVHKGYASEEEVSQALARQCDVEFVSLEEAEPAREATSLVNKRLAAQHRCVPLRLEGETLVLAMANPLDLIAIEDVELATRRSVRPVVATGSAIGKALSKAYAG